MNQDWGISQIIDRNGKHYVETWGDICRDNVDGFCHALMCLPLGVVLGMSDLEIDDGPTLACIVSALRKIGPSSLVEAPRMLAHTLYKINALKGIHLDNPRSY